MMSWYDWLIVIIPVAFVIYMGIYTRRYLKDVTAFLSAGRVCGRYVISIGDIAGSLSIIGLVSYVEIHYKTGFALAESIFSLVPFFSPEQIGFCVAPLETCFESRFRF